MMDVLAELTVPRDARFVATLRHVLVRVLDEQEAPDDCISQLQLALGEACANVIHHARDSEDYTVELHLRDHECEIHVIDHGPGFVPGPDDLEPSAPAHEDGRGLALMSELVEDLAFAQNADGMEVRFANRW